MKIKYQPAIRWAGTNAKCKTKEVFAAYCSVVGYLMSCHAEPQGEASGLRNGDSSLRSE